MVTNLIYRVKLVYWKYYFLYKGLPTHSHIHYLYFTKRHRISNKINDVAYRYAIGTSIDLLAYIHKTKRARIISSLRKYVFTQDFSYIRPGQTEDLWET